MSQYRPPEVATPAPGPESWMYPCPSLLIRPVDVTSKVLVTAILTILGSVVSNTNIPETLEDGSPTGTGVPPVFPELDTRTKKHLKEVALSLVYAFAVMLVAYLQRDWLSFYQREAVEQLVVRRRSLAVKPFSYIKTSSSFWTWSETHLMDALYDDGNENPLQSHSFYQVQWTKFRQERVSHGKLISH
uniref:Uncharacterized protein n=1 Tax=Branchiostoma floridae TaxID=7739 RepID=C3Y1U6_BRAFL|eukprot:XP_002609826.1 hypothetical protein BRAFLDRAFT_78657 [Branchiostoma floridae]